MSAVRPLKLESAIRNPRACAPGWPAIRSSSVDEPGIRSREQRARILHWVPAWSGVTVKCCIRTGEPGSAPPVPPWKVRHLAPPQDTLRFDRTSAQPEHLTGTTERGVRTALGRWAPQVHPNGPVRRLLPVERRGELSRISETRPPSNRPSLTRSMSQQHAHHSTAAVPPAAPVLTRS